MAVINSNNFINHLIWSGLIDKATCGELKEAIEQCTVKDIYTKDDMVAMLEELKKEMNTIKDCEYQIYGKEHWGFARKCQDIIQQKINALKADRSEEV